MAEGMDERIQLIVGRRFSAMEALLTVAIVGVDAIEEQYMKVDVKVQRGAKALDQGH